MGADDYVLAVVYTYTNGYGETAAITEGFSNDQVFPTGNGGGISNDVTPGGNGGTEPDVNEPILVATFDDGTTLTLEQLQLPENGDKYGYDYNDISVTSIGSGAFYNCYNLTSIEVSDGVTSIGTNAFYGCSSLTNLTIGNGVTSIGSGAFQNCSRLTSIEIPDSVTSIGDSAFFKCTNLTSIEIPDSVTSVGDSAFRDCTGLTSVTIGNGLKSITYTFYGCTSLTSITFNGSIRQWSSISKSNWNNDVPATYVQCTDGQTRA